MNMRPCVTPEAIAAVARAAEAAGFESFWGGEHLALADPQTEASPMPPLIDFVDLNVTMAFAAAHTRTLRFGTGIMILPLRNPVVLAKQLASVDVMSGGRLIFGVGHRQPGVRIQRGGHAVRSQRAAGGRDDCCDEGIVDDGAGGVSRPLLFI